LTNGQKVKPKLTNHCIYQNHSLNTLLNNVGQNAEMNAIGQKA